MFDPLTIDRKALLRELIADCEAELKIKQEQLEAFYLKEIQLRFAMEVLEGRGERELARDLRFQLDEAGRRYRAQQRLIQQTEKLLSRYRAQLARLERDTSLP